MLDRREVVYVDKVEGTHPMVRLAGVRVGSRAPAHCTAVGKVLLAEREPEEVRALLQSTGMRAMTRRTITSIAAFEEELKQVRIHGIGYDRQEIVAGGRVHGRAGLRPLGQRRRRREPGDAVVPVRAQRAQPRRPAAGRRRRDHRAHVRARDEHAGPAAGPGGGMSSLAPESVDCDVFRNVIGHFASGVTVITARGDDKDHGMTASAVTSLSMDPPMLLVCINDRNPTAHAVSASGAFAVNILAESQADLAEQFGRPGDDKFSGVDKRYGCLGEPVLGEALAHLECRVEEEVRGGTHRVFLSRVVHADARDGAPLTYFRGTFGRFQQAQDEALYEDLRALVLSRDTAIGERLALDDLAARLQRRPRRHLPRAHPALVGRARRAALRTATTRSCRWTPTRSRGPPTRAW